MGFVPNQKMEQTQCLSYEVQSGIAYSPHIKHRDGKNKIDRYEKVQAGRYLLLALPEHYVRLLRDEHRTYVAGAWSSFSLLNFKIICYEDVCK